MADTKQKRDIFTIIRDFFTILTGAAAVFAIGLAICEGVERREHQRLSFKHQKLSFKPILGFNKFDNYVGHDAEDGDIHEIKIEVVNGGTGTAIIKDLIFFYDGELISKNNFECYLKFINKKHADSTILENYVGPYFGHFSPDDPFRYEKPLILFKYAYVKKMEKEVLEIVEKMGWRVKYQSIFEESFDRDFQAVTNKYPEQDKFCAFEITNEAGLKESYDVSLAPQVDDFLRLASAKQDASSFVESMDAEYIVLAESESNNADDSEKHEKGMTEKESVERGPRCPEKNPDCKKWATGLLQQNHGPRCPEKNPDCKKWPSELSQ